MENKDQTIYVFGHKNPDTDSICSALAYAYLKQKLGQTNVKAARLGCISKETKYALDYFGVEAPIFLKEIKMRVKDLSLGSMETVTLQDSIKRAVDVIVNKNKHMTPVVDENKRLIGVITLPDLYPALIGVNGKSHLNETKTPFSNIIDVLEAIVIQGHYPDQYIIGDIYILSEVDKESGLSKGDLLILGDSEENREKAFKSGASCLIIACKDKSAISWEVPTDFEGVVLAVESSVFNIIKLISRTVPIDSMVNKKLLEYFELEDAIDEVKEQIQASKHRSFPVVDTNGKVKGLLSRSDLMKVNRQKVILVDHNESGQSIKGIEEAEILEIIDHHRIANVQTMAPLFYRAEPVGCTSTIIADLYDQHNIPIPKKIAGLMLSAIISDTLLFNSPTCTEKDKQTAKRLAVIAGVDLKEYGMNMIVAGTTIKDESPEDLITRDMKKFTLGQYKVVISQINTGDYKGISDMLPLLKEKIEAYCEQESFDLGVLMITNIVFGGSELIVVGKEKRIAQNAFNMEMHEDSIYLAGVFSRKKQIVPVLMNAAQL